MIEYRMDECFFCGETIYWDHTHRMQRIQSMWAHWHTDMVTCMDTEANHWAEPAPERPQVVLV